MDEKVKKQKGQATVEFILMVSILMAYSLFFFRFTFIFAYANYVQYATYMSARAYLSSASSVEVQRQRASQTLVALLKMKGSPGTERYKVIAQGINQAGGGPGEMPDPGGATGMFFLEDTSGSSDLSWQKGVRYVFRGRMFLVPLAGFGPGQKNVNDLTLTSESYLGREPTSLECESEMGIKLWDNGC